MINRPYLIVLCGPRQGEELCITSDSMVIGRDSSSDIILPDDRVSRRHARIFLQDGKWMLEDLGSRNHTRLAKIKLEPGNKKAIVDGNEIQLASQIILCFQDPAATKMDESKIIVNELWLDMDRRDVYIHNKALKPKLTLCSFAILKLLYEKSQTPHPLASNKEIGRAGWSGMGEITEEMIEAEIYRLRKRLKELEPNHNFIQSERGRGRWFVQFSED